MRSKSFSAPCCGGTVAGDTFLLHCYSRNLVAQVFLAKIQPSRWSTQPVSQSEYGAKAAIGNVWDRYYGLSGRLWRTAGSTEAFRLKVVHGRHRMVSCEYILQERIITVSFGRNQERFTWSVFLVLCNRIMTTTLAAGVLTVRILSGHTRASWKSAAHAYHHKLACTAACGNVCDYSCNEQSSTNISHRLLLCMRSGRALLLRLVVVTHHICSRSAFLS